MRTILPFTADECFAPNSDNAGSGSFDKKVFSADNGGGSANSGSSTSSDKIPGGGGIRGSISSDTLRNTGADGGHSDSVKGYTSIDSTS